MLADKMTFTEFKTFKNYVLDVTKNNNLEVKPLENKENGLMLENIQNSDPLLVLEIVISAYDSNFILGGFFANEGKGSLIIHE